LHFYLGHSVAPDTYLADFKGTNSAKVRRVINALKRGVDADPDTRLPDEAMILLRRFQLPNYAVMVKDIQVGKGSNKRFIHKYGFSPSRPWF